MNPASNRSSPDIETETITLKEMFRRFDNHYILLGHPGAGKTTSSKQLCRLALDHNEQLSKDFNFPLVVLLRELNTAIRRESRSTRNQSKPNVSSVVFRSIENILNINISINECIFSDLF